MSDDRTEEESDRLFYQFIRELESLVNKFEALGLEKHRIVEALHIAFHGEKEDLS